MQIKLSNEPLVMPDGLTPSLDIRTFSIIGLDVNGDIIKHISYIGTPESAKEVALQMVSEDARIKDFDINED